MKRFYEAAIFELLSLFPCVAIVGVRQCGKTTLLQQLPKTWTLYDLEKGDDFEIISHDPDLFFRLNPKHTAIDEAQLLPDIFAALRVAIDADRNEPGRFVITGSSSPELLNAISESLAGRVAIIEMAPFSLSEAYSSAMSLFYQKIHDKLNIEALLNLPIQHSIQNIHHYWLKGGYPEPWIKNSFRFTNLWMKNYQQTYLNRDILRLFPGLNQQKYRLFINMLGHLSGRIINYSHIARTLGISQPTAREYMQIAHGTFLWRHIPSFEKNISKRIVKHPKGYLRDTGLLHFMLHLGQVNDLLAHPQMGSSWESMVIENILRNFSALGIDIEYYHYRTGGGAEVDLILEGSFGLLPIEIKYGQRVNQKSLRSLKDFIREHKCRFGVVINNDEKVRLYDESIIGIPMGCL